MAPLPRATDDRGMTSPSLATGTIVVAVDGSQHAQRAVSWAAEQAHLERRPLLVAHAAGEGDVRSAGWVGLAGTAPIEVPDLLRSSQHVVDDAVDLALHLRPDLEVRRHLVLGDPRQVLVDLADHAHLVVMGSHGRGVFRSILLGSVSAAVARAAACPVVVCRPTPADATLRGVVVGADGSPESQVVLEFAFQQASLRRLPLTVVRTFWDARAVAPGYDAALEADPELDELRRLLAESAAGLSEKYPDVPVTLRLAHGLVDQALSALAEDWGLVVVGRQPIGSLRRIVGGSVAIAVLERARCTVAVVPEPEATEPESTAAGPGAGDRTAGS